MKNLKTKAMISRTDCRRELRTELRIIVTPRNGPRGQIANTIISVGSSSGLKGSGVYPVGLALGRPVNLLSWSGRSD